MRINLIIVRDRKMNGFHRSRRKRPNIQEAEQWLNCGIGAGMRAEDYVSIAERKKRLVQLADELKEKLKKHLPRSRNLELVILKCHLLVEFMFNQYIELMAPTEGVIESERFTFKQKEALVHMLGFPSAPVFFPSIDLLNSIRNLVAHTLVIDRKKIDQLIRLNSEDPDDAKRLTDNQRATALKQITKFLCGFMLGVVDGMHAMEWIDDQEKAEQSGGGDAEDRAPQPGRSGSPRHRRSG